MPPRHPTGDTNAALRHRPRHNEDIGHRPFRPRQTYYTYDQAQRLTTYAGSSLTQTYTYNGDGVLIDGQHRLAAVVDADVPVAMTVYTEVDDGTFDVLDTGKRRNAADVLAIEGEKSGFDPGWWTPRKRGCSSWEVSVGSSLLSTRTRP